MCIVQYVLWVVCGVVRYCVCRPTGMDAERNRVTPLLILPPRRPQNRNHVGGDRGESSAGLSLPDQRYLLPDTPSVWRTR